MTPHNSFRNRALATLSEALARHRHARQAAIIAGARLEVSAINDCIALILEIARGMGIKQSEFDTECMP